MSASRRDVAATLLPGFAGRELPDWLERRLRDGLGGVCLFAENVGGPEELRALTARIRAANPEAVIAVDEEGGDVTRLHHFAGSPYPGAAVLGRIDDPALTRAVGRAVGEELRAAGCTLAFAPDADVNSDPRNPVIGVRSFGSDAALVARHTAAWTEGVQAAGVSACAKHFPGHGDTAVDSHLGLPVVDLDRDALSARELMPFRAAIAAGTRTVMTSHILLPQLDPQRPATFSARILEGLLREELGFRGVVVSDALDMVGASGEHGIAEAAVRALAGGCDLLCIGTRNTDDQLGEIERAVLAAIEEGRLRPERVREAAERVRSLSRHQDPGERLPDASGGLPVGPERVREVFGLSARAEEWLRSGTRAAHVVRLETVPNIAVGQVPWGPFAAVRADGAPRAPWEEDAVIVLGPEDDPAALLATLPGPVVLVGKDLRRHPFALTAIDLLRARPGADVLVAEMGWSEDDDPLPDVRCHGASRLLGTALLQLLEQTTAG